MRILLIVALLAVALGGFTRPEARAAEAPAPAQAPQDVAPVAVYGVFGDSLGDGVWAGLYGLLRRHPEIVLQRRAKVGAGLTRPDYAAWIADLPKQIEAGGVTVAVVMFGTNDQQGLRDENRKGHAFGSPGWKAAYAARIDAVLTVFREHSVDSVWVGLPVMRKDEANVAAETLNALFAAGAERAGIPFVPTIEDFKGPDGQFAISLPDPAQRQRLVRAEDGVHFTIYGYELIASKVLAAIRESFAASAPLLSPTTAKPDAAPARALPAVLTPDATKPTVSTPAVPTPTVPAATAVPVPAAAPVQSPAPPVAPPATGRPAVPAAAVAPPVRPTPARAPAVAAPPVQTSPVQTSPAAALATDRLTRVE